MNDSSSNWKNRHGGGWVAKYKIVHKTVYEYSEIVGLCHNEFHLKPRESERQKLLDFRIFVNPSAALVKERFDYFGNPVHYLSVEDTHTNFEVVSESIVEVNTKQSDERGDLDATEMLELLAGLSGEEYLSMTEWRLDSPIVEKSETLAQYGRDLFQTGQPFLESVAELNTRIYNDFEYLNGITHAGTPALEAFQGKKGVCQDFAHVAIGVLRSLGFPARYVSGYIETFPPPGKPKLVGADATHAWFSVWTPSTGWVDFDPTNNQLTGKGYITTAWGRDYSDVTPIKGVVFGGGSHTVQVAVDVNEGP